MRLELGHLDFATPARLAGSLYEVPRAPVRPDCCRDRVDRRGAPWSIFTFRRNSFDERSPAGSPCELRRLLEHTAGLARRRRAGRGLLSWPVLVPSRSRPGCRSCSAAMSRCLAACPVLAVGVTAPAALRGRVLAGLLLNARHLPFGLAIGDTLGRRPWLGSHLMTDEAVAFALARADPVARRTAYWLAGLTLYVVWNVATVLGALAGHAVGDPAAFGIDAAFPPWMMALLLPGSCGTGRRCGWPPAARPSRWSRPLLPPAAR